MCALSVSLECIWSRAWNAESGPYRRKAYVYSLICDSSRSRQQVIAGTWQGARPK